MGAPVPNIQAIVHTGEVLLPRQVVEFQSWWDRICETQQGKFLRAPGEWVDPPPARMWKATCDGCGAPVQRGQHQCLWCLRATMQ